MNVSHAPMSKEELDEREDALAEVLDPMYLLARGEEGDGNAEAEAEGEVENTDMDGEVPPYPDGGAEAVGEVPDADADGELDDGMMGRGPGGRDGERLVDVF